MCKVVKDMYLKNIRCSNCKGVVIKKTMECIGCGSKCTILHGGMISIAVFDFKYNSDDKIKKD